MPPKIVWWDGTAKIKGVDAEQAYALLSTIPRNDPDAIVTAAEPLASPIHSWFEWDDTIAGRKYRLDQASKLPRSLRIVYPTASGEKSAPAFVSVSKLNLEEASPERWVTTMRALGDSELRDLVIERAKREAREWVERYEGFEELAQIIARMRDVL